MVFNIYLFYLQYNLPTALCLLQQFIYCKGFEKWRWIRLKTRHAMNKKCVFQRSIYIFTKMCIILRKTHTNYVHGSHSLFYSYRHFRPFLLYIDRKYNFLLKLVFPPLIVLVFKPSLKNTTSNMFFTTPKLMYDLLSISIDIRQNV